MHPTSGQYLSVTEQKYQADTGQNKVLKVVGSKQVSNKSLWKVVLKRPVSPFEEMGLDATLELYHEGTVKNFNRESEVLNNTQSSMADLQNLHSKELELLEHLTINEILMKTVRDEFEQDGYSLESVKDSDVLHPIDSYNLIKRTSRTWTRIYTKLKALDKSTIIGEKLKKFSMHCLSWEKSRKAIAMGILHIQQFYDLDTEDLIKGVLKDNYRNITYISATKLNVGDAKLFAEVALEENNLIGAIRWLRLFPQLKKRYKKVAKIHDDLVNYDPKRAIREKFIVGMEPVEETVFKETEMPRLMKLEQAQCPPFTGGSSVKASCPSDCISRIRSAFIHKLCQV